MRLVADANVLLAAVLGGRAAHVLTHAGVDEVLVPTRALEEVRQYAVALARDKGLREDVVLLALAALPVTPIAPAVYRGSLAEARSRIGRRDPEDIHVLALALHLGVPVWSNDRDFEGTGVVRFTTAQLLATLGIHGRPRRE